MYFESKLEQNDKQGIKINCFQYSSFDRLRRRKKLQFLQK